MINLFITASSQQPFLLLALFFVPEFLVPNTTTGDNYALVQYFLQMWRFTMIHYTLQYVCSYALLYH